MKVSDIISRVRTVAGDTDVLQFRDESLIAWINDAMREIASDNQLLQKSATSNTVINQGKYDIPTDILKLHSIIVDGSDLRLIDLETAKVEGYLNDDKGKSQVGWIWAGKINLYPAPDSVVNLEIIYTRSPREVDAEADTPEIPASYHGRLVDYCLAQVAQQDDDMNRYAIKMEEFRTGVQSLKDIPEWENNQYPFIHYTEGVEYYGQY